MSDPARRNIATELVGTALVMVAGPGLIVLTEGRLDALAYAASFGAAVALAMAVIGALANPAATLALLIVRDVTVREAVGDWIGQLAGGIAGAAMIWGINDQTRAPVGATGWDRNGLAELGSAFAGELLFTLVVVVVMLAAVGQGLSRSGIALATGTAYAIGMLALLGVSGGGLNPARAIGSALFSDTDPNALGQVWMFVVAPLVAAVAAVFVWLAIDDATVDDTIFDETFLDDLADRIDGTDD